MLTMRDLHEIPDEIANRMMMAHGSANLLRALRGEPELVSELGPMPVVPKPPRVAAPKTWPRPVAIKPDAHSREIIEAVAGAFGLSVDKIMGRDRSTTFILARSVVVKMLHDRGRSAAHIGRVLNGRDHSTILNAIDKFDSYAARYPFVRSVYDSLSVATA